MVESLARGTVSDRRQLPCAEKIHRADFLAADAGSGRQKKNGAVYDEKCILAGQKTCRARHLNTPPGRLGRRRIMAGAASRPGPCAACGPRTCATRSSNRRHRRGVRSAPGHRRPGRSSRRGAGSPARRGRGQAGCAGIPKRAMGARDSSMRRCGRRAGSRRARDGRQNRRYNRRSHPTASNHLRV